MKHNYEKTLKKALVLCCFLMSLGLFSQDKVVIGAVTDQDGAPLPGVNIVQKGTGNGVVADFDGNYEIKLRSGAQTLIFTYVGFSSKEISTSGKSVVNVTLEEDAQFLEEVVVVGYGTQTRSDLVGSVGSVKGEDIAKMPVPTFDMALQGRTAGLNIVNTSSEPGGEVTIRIRGNNSILGDNSPLVVVDGYPMSTGSEASNSGIGQGNQTSTNVLSFLNPAEIESVEVLKDAASTAIYGSRGANGVIMVTTKKGNYKQATNINFTTETGFSNIQDFPEVLDGPTYASWRNEIALSNGATELPFDGDPLPLPENVTTTDWLDRILRTGLTTRYQLAVSGGGDKSRYFLSANYLKNGGIVKYTDFSRGNIRLNIDNNLTDRLSMSTSVNYVRTKNNRSGEGSGAIINAGAVFSAYKNSPTSSPGDAIDEGDGTTAFFTDPLVELSDTRNETYNENLILSIQSKYKISEGLIFNLTTGTTSSNSRREGFYPKTTRLGKLYDSRAVYNISSAGNYLVESYLTYNKAMDLHNIDIAGGYSYQIDNTRRLNTTVVGFPVDVLETDNIGLGLTPSIPSSSRIERILSSYYARLNYNYDKRYYLSLTGRADGSSVFAENQKWGYFPSVGIGWTISNESFLKDSATLSNLKFRASYGITGSQSIQPLQSLTLLGTANAVYGDVLYSGLAPTRLGNPNLEWEKTKQFNTGLDIGFLKDRFSASIDYYKKTTEDLLLNFPLPKSAGLGSITANAGSVENKGIEVVVGGYLIDKKDFKWNSNFNWSNNKATVLSLGDTDADIFGPGPATNIVNEPSNIMRVGEAFGSLYGYKVIGLLQESDFDGSGAATVPVFGTTPKPGQWKYADLSGPDGIPDGVINGADRDIIGDSNPDYIFGWNNDFTYKNFTLSVFIQGSQGNDLMNIDRLFLSSGHTANNIFLDYYENRWTPTNPTNDPRYPKVDQPFLQPNSAIVEDGSYIRLKNVSLGYNIPVQKMKVLTSARLYVTATNLLTITDYSGFDPEVNIRGGNNLAQGVDFASYPRAQTITLGINIGL
ncbi:TonB-dependent receptor [Arenibacter sp. F26102]|uniref:SusC/RagA family TonB-linked outer membrane protein n=1 Tax=Arenibacter sp. F26102 TaxID=2926416 RepID=UPI001FF35FA3|nr:TonB-dependent receptor [Arenibacter sp. F26102]MCK0148094.1 TonB-dependent receptor [Arenibacter sp. F26102]